MKQKLIGVLLLLLVVSFVVTGCASNRAEETTSVVSLSYGIDHYNKFRKTVIGVGVDQNLFYHVYPSDTEDDDINYIDTTRIGPAVPDLEITKEITEEQWKALVSSKSLENLWGKSKAAGTDEELCGTSVLLISVSTPEMTKQVGGFVIDDQWLYETGQILDTLALSSGAREEGEVLLQRLVDTADEAAEETV